MMKHLTPPVMRIERVEIVPYALPFREPYVTARGQLRRREMVLVRLRTDEGLEGLGEAVPLSLRGGVSLPDIVDELVRAAEALTGADASDDFLTLCVNIASRGLSAPARAALLIAQLDLQAKAGDVPAWRLLGAERAEPVECNATLTAGEPALVAAQAERWAALGFQTMKLKVGMPGDVAAVAAVREALGDGPPIRVDANGAWPPDEAVLKLGAMERHGIELAEQPTADLEDLRLVSQQTAIPIAADESVASAADARRAVELGACELAAVKLAKVGGIASARAIARTLPVYLSSALDGPVGIAAAGHLAQAMRGTREDAGIAHGLATQLLFAHTVAAVECEVRGGLLHLPDGPGLAVTIDEEALERHRL